MKRKVGPERLKIAGGVRSKQQRTNDDHDGLGPFSTLRPAAESLRECKEKAT